MKRHDAERLLISFFIALGLFAVLTFLSTLVDWGKMSEPEYSGPVYVTLGDQPLLRQPEQQTPPEPVKAQKPERRPERRRQTKRESKPETASRQDRRVSESSDSSGGTDTANEEKTVVPTEKENTRKQPSGGQESSAAAGETVSAAQGSEATAQPVLGDTEKEPVTGEKGPDRDSGGTSEGESGETSPGVQSGGETKKEPGMLGDLSGLDAALAKAADEGDTPSAESGENTVSEENQIGTAGSPVEIEQLAAKRRPISIPQPEISSDLARNLPPTLELVVSFTLLPSGYITDLNIRPDSGNTEIDSIIRDTIRKWRFEPVPQNAGSVKVRVLYRIHVR